MHRLAVFILAVLADALVGEPPTSLHPTAWVGQAASVLEGIGRKLPARGQLLLGALVALALPLAVGLLARKILRLLRRTPCIGMIVEAALFKSSFAVRALLGEAEGLACLLREGELERARIKARSLVSRDTTHLDEAHLVSAGLESLAENTTDAFLAPWLYYLMWGTEGALVYRTINTLDAMWGYHGPYEFWGKGAARLDDLANLIPARLGAFLLALASGKLRQAITIALAQHARTESPNAGWTMAALAGALGVELEKVGHYRLGFPRHALAPSLLDEGIAVVRRVAALGAALMTVLLWAKGWFGREKGRSS